MAPSNAYDTLTARQIVKRQRYFQRPSTRSIVIPAVVSIVVLIVAFIAVIVCVKRRDKRKSRLAKQVSSSEVRMVERPPVYEAAVHDFPERPPPVYGEVVRGNGRGGY